MSHFTRLDDERAEAVESALRETPDILILCRDLAHRMDVSDLTFAEIEYRKDAQSFTITLRR